MCRVLIHRVLPFVVLLLAASAAVPTPVPKDFGEPARRLEKSFGKTVPSPKGGEFKFDAKGLTAKMPAARFGNECSPHVGMHTQALVTGDFEMVVAVRLPAADGLPAKILSLGGGLFAREPDKKSNTFVSVAQNLTSRPPRAGRPVGWMRESITVYDGTDDSFDEDTPINPAAPYHFRLTRVGDTFTTAVSTDGKEWREFKPKAVKLPETLGVGVFCYNRTGEPTDAMFDGFIVRPLK